MFHNIPPFAQELAKMLELKAIGPELRNGATFQYIRIASMQVGQILINLCRIQKKQNFMKLLALESCETIPMVTRNPPIQKKISTAKYAPGTKVAIPGVISILSVSIQFLIFINRNHISCPKTTQKIHITLKPFKNNKFQFQLVFGTVIIFLKLSTKEKHFNTQTALELDELLLETKEPSTPIPIMSPIPARTKQLDQSITGPAYTGIQNVVLKKMPVGEPVFYMYRAFRQSCILVPQVFVAISYLQLFGAHSPIYCMPTILFTKRMVKYVYQSLLYRQLLQSPRSLINLPEFMYTSAGRCSGCTSQLNISSAHYQEHPAQHTSRISNTNQRDIKFRLQSTQLQMNKSTLITKSKNHQTEISISCLFQLIIKRSSKRGNQQDKNRTEQVSVDTTIIVLLLMICRGFRVSKFLFSSFNANKDYYKTLNVAITATPDEIKKSFRLLAKKYHPDSNKGNDDKFKQINQAYQVLSSEATKRDYDDVRRSQNQQQSRSNSSYGSSSSSSSSSYQNPNTSYRQQSHQYNTYRGYEQQQNWNNRSFREKTMNDIFKQQQQQFMQNHHRYTGSTQHDDNLWKRSQSSHQPNTRNYGKPKSVEDELNDAIKQAAERAKITREKVRKAYEEEEKRREEEFRKYRDSQNEKIVNELKKKVIDMAGGLKNTVEGIGRVGEFVKENVNTAAKVGKMAKKLWDDYKNSKKQ